jgi:hypothetical protein
MPLSNKDDLTDRITIRCTAAQRELWEQASAAHRRRLADWIRLSLDEIAAAQVEQATDKQSPTAEKGTRRSK